MAEARPLTPFTEAVIKLIRGIPCGRVATYGQIAELAGRPRAARAVVGILGAKKRAYNLPWHRVIGAGGRIAFPKGSAHFRKQLRLSKSEGVLFHAGVTDLAQFGWKKKPLGYKHRLVPKMFG